MSEEETINRLLNSIAICCDGNMADEVKAIIIKQQKEIEELRKYIQKYKIRIPMPEEYCNSESWGEEITIAQKEYISKDKIKTKINDLRFLLYSFEKERDEKLVCDSEESINCLLGQISILNSLLEEK